MRRSHFLALAALLALLGCSRAQKPAEAAPAAPAPATAPSSLPGTSSAEATPAQIAAPATEAQIASAPHPQTIETNAPAAVPAPVPASGLTLHLLVPAGHAPAWLVEELQAAIGAKVAVATYDTDAECDAAMSAPGAAYDLVGVTDRYAADLIGQQKLRPLPADVAPLPDQPAAEFLHHYFDPRSAYTWPYGYTLLGFATATLGTPPLQKWHDLGHEALTVSLPADGPLRAALWALADGKTGPAKDEVLPVTWQKAAADAPTAGQPGKVWIDTLARLHPLKSRPNEKWEVVLPAEGSLITLYHWAIPAATTQPQLAEAALRAVAAPARAARLDVENNLAATQPEALKTLAPSVSADPLVYPSQRELNNSRFVRTH